MKTKIEWATHTWNPVTGCTPISEGCKNCYAAKMAKRLAGRGGYPKDNPFKPGIIHEDAMEWPLRLRKPARIFVCSMGDLFHEAVPDEVIARIFSTMYGCPRHLFLILTKRPERMKKFIEACRSCGERHGWITHNGSLPKAAYNGTGIVVGGLEWPLPNVWLGVTCENQAAADERIPMLLQIPAAVRFVSVEPMLGPVDLGYTFTRAYHAGGGQAAIDWVICGGETGPGARPMHPDWARSLRDQCLAAFVPFFLKSFGEWAASTEPLDVRNKKTGDFETLPVGAGFIRVGKKKTGDLLDGERWHQFPGGKP